MENLSGGDCDCCDCDCDGGKTKSTPSLNFGLRLEFDKILFISKSVVYSILCLVLYVGLCRFVFVWGV